MRRKDEDKQVQEDQAVRLQRLFEQLAATRFFGTVSLSVQSGRVKDVRIELNRKLHEL